MNKYELLKRDIKYKAHRVKVYEDTLVRPDGKKVYYDFVENRNGSGVLLVDKDEKLCAQDEEEERVQLSHSFGPSKSISVRDSESKNAKSSIIDLPKQ